MPSCWMQNSPSFKARWGAAIKSSNRFASNSPTLSSGGPHKDHTWGIRHLVEPIPDVGSVGRRESVAEAQHRCGFREIRPLAWIHGYSETVWLTCVVDGSVWFRG